MATAFLRLASLMMIVLTALGIWVALNSAVGVTPAVAAISAIAFVAAVVLWRGMRWLAWLVMLGVIVTLGVTMARPGGPAEMEMARYAMAAVEAVAVLSIFAALWRDAPMR